MILGWYNPGEMPAYHRRISRPVFGEVTRALGSLALEYGIYLSFGLSEIHDETLYNAQVLLNPRGEIQAIHRKWNLKPGERNADYQPGADLVTITNVKGIKTGIIICSDAASLHTMWALIKRRLDLVILSLADDQDERLFMARFNARLYDAWVVTANRYGQEGGEFWNGHIVISDPLGELRATGHDKEQYLVYELNFAPAQSRLKRAIRNGYVKAPLVLHILRNWKVARSYL
jgi:predicted amidohydrolase